MRSRMETGLLAAFLSVAVGLESVELVSAEENWQNDRELYDQGLRACEKFREGLLRASEAGPGHAKLIGKAIERFPGVCVSKLEGRPNLSGFHVSVDEFLKQIRGETKLDGERVFGKFTGRWYGRWDQMVVDHHWHVVRQRNPAMSLAPALPRIVADQYCWIGDGFCWNYVTQLDNRSTSNVILGMCYHLDSVETARIRLRRPHVGYCPGPGMLIWVTSKEIFFEHIVSPDDVGSSRYVITGFAYEIKDGQLRNSGNAFQAVYTRRAEQRPVWHQFDIEMQVP